MGPYRAHWAQWGPWAQGPKGPAHWAHGPGLGPFQEDETKKNSRSSHTFADVCDETAAWLKSYFQPLFSRSLVSSARNTSVAKKLLKSKVAKKKLPRARGVAKILAALLKFQPFGYFPGWTNEHVPCQSFFDASVAHFRFDVGNCSPLRAAKDFQVT